MGWPGGVQVSLKEKTYPVFIGKDLLQQSGPLLKKAGFLPRHLLVVSQKEVAAHYENPLRDSLSREGFENSLFLTPSAKSSEASKTQAVWAKLIKALSSLDGKNRSLGLVALGGGVIGDLTGFAASVYRRGIPYVQVPTTLTAQVDSAIGGKTGVDLPEGKNLLGAIYQPRAVISDVRVLGTLPQRHWSDGFAEVIKYGVIKDAGFFSWLEKKNMDEIRVDARALEKVVTRCARIKARVVSLDEFDKTGTRMILNFGHTAGHAVEAAAAYSGRYTHGEAVAVGMLIACDISEKLGILKDRSLTGRLESILLKFGLPVYIKGLDQAAILKAMGYDKKSEGQKNRFVLPEKLGKVLIQPDVPVSVIEEALSKRKL